MAASRKIPPANWTAGTATPATPARSIDTERRKTLARRAGFECGKSKGRCGRTDPAGRTAEQANVRGARASRQKPLSILIRLPQATIIL